MDKVQVSAYITRELNRLLKVELARREQKFSHWVEAKVREELGRDGEPDAEAVQHGSVQ